MRAQGDVLELDKAIPGQEGGSQGGLMFVLFSNRLGCAGSLLISLAATGLLLALVRLL